jgi:hypothetical protein
VALDDENKDNELSPLLASEMYMSRLDNMTIQLNEIYESLVRSGFRPTDAVQMVAKLMADMIMYGMVDPTVYGDPDDELDNDQEDPDDGLEDFN